MDYDLILVIGIVIGVLTVPSMLSAWVDGRAPRGSAVAVLVSGVLVVIALTQNPQRYAFNEMPQVFVEVIGRYLR
ncbi:MAG: hypothetical protein RIR62_1640 [Pseudomonadota bacterium]|jgi:hypothetical protein